jgi:integrase
MASLLFDRKSNHFFIRFRYGGRSFKRSLGSGNAKLAHAQAGRIEETLLLLRHARLSVPPGGDPIAYILSDGRKLHDDDPQLLTLLERTNAYKSNRIPGHKEANTVKTEDIHIRHLVRILKGNLLAQTIGYTHLQNYVATRLGELVGGKRPVSTETVRKEVATFRVIWHWAVKHKLIEGPAPVVGLDYPKRDQKLPFMTAEQIEHIIKRDGLSPSEAKSYWECLYLRSYEVQEALAYLRKHAVHAYVYPLTLLIAHTGIRLSEAIRSRREDIDLSSGNILVREKKRSRTRAITFRRVELTAAAQTALGEWLGRERGGPHTFSRPWDTRRLCEPGPPQPVDPDTAHDHFKLSFNKSKWQHVRGFHVFRHSFASNLAAAGVDQRIIDEWMGHQTEEMRCRYRHLLPETKKAGMAKLFDESPLRIFGT